MNHSMSEHKKQLNQITKISDIIRKKYNLIKSNKTSTEETTNEILKPVIDPLKQLVKNSQNDAIPYTNQNQSYENNDDDDFISVAGDHEGETNSTETYETPFLYNKTAPKKHLFRTPISADFDTSDHNESHNDDNIIDNSIFNNSASQTPQIEKYIRLVKQKHRNCDTTTGVRKLVNGFHIGDCKVQFAGDELLIDSGDNFKLTKGLLELLFMKSPNKTHISEHDKSVYKNIILSTHAHKKRYAPDGSVRSKEKKFKNVIADIINFKTGRGLPNYLTLNDKKIDYVYWNNANELVERLRLLIASREAGNQSHSNEIISILEELREAGIIY